MKTVGLLFLAALPSTPLAAPQGSTTPKSAPKPTGSLVRDVPSPAPVALRDVTSVAGLAGLFTASFTNHSGGVAWVDYNTDYWPDLFITNGQGLSHWLFRNNGDGTFSDVTSIIPKANLALEEAGVNFADVDNDGDSDIFVTVDALSFTGTVTGGPNLFYRNDGGAFAERAGPMGLVDPNGRRSITSAFADYNRDGLVDLYVGKLAMLVRPLDFYDSLFRNQGGVSFVDEGTSSGLDGYGRNNLVSIWFDVNADGWADLYQGNVGEFQGGYVEPENHDVLFVSDGNGITFTDETALNPTIGDDATAAMGMDVGDIDNDGDWDLYITDNPAEGAAPFGNVLYQGDGSGLGDNSCVEAGICLVDNSWPCNFADFNRDGWVDLWVGSTFAAVDDALFLNLQDGTFKRSTQKPFQNNNCRGGSIADYDGDGDVDVFLWRSMQDSRLVQNRGLDGNRWLSLKLLGTSSNRDAIGAVVRVSTGQLTQMRRVSGGDSAHSQQELILHFGIGAATTADVSVTWPNGAAQSIPGLGANDLYFVDETLGLLAEELTASSASWSSGTQDLALLAESNFGGRTGLTLVGYGALSWQPASGDFAATFAGPPTPPGTVTVRTSRGSEFVLPVTVVP